MQSSFRTCSFIAVSVFVTAMLCFSPSWASDWTLSPSLLVEEEYNDNILFSPEGQELDDYVTNIRPRLEAAYRTQRLDLTLDSGLGIERYLDNDDLDTVDQDHRLALSYSLSPTLALRARGYFRADTTLQTELTEEGLLANREDRLYFRGALGFDYIFSSRFHLSGDWLRGYTDYDTRYDDSLTDTVTLKPACILSPTTSLFLNLSYTNTEYDRSGDPSVANYAVSPSFLHKFAEDYYVSGGAGYRYTEYKTGSTDENTDGLVFNLSFHRDWKRASAELVGLRDQYSTVDQRSIERNRLIMNGTYRLSARFSTSISASVGRNREDRPEGGYADETDYYGVTPTFRYYFTPTIVLRGSVNYYEYKYEDDDNRERFRALLALDLTWPRL